MMEFFGDVTVVAVLLSLHFQDEKILFQGSEMLTDMGACLELSVPQM